MRLDSKSALLLGGDSGPVVVPGDPKSSLVIKAVHRVDGLEMPPDYSLTESQINDLTLWISSGANWPDSDSDQRSAMVDKWKSHWAFQPITTDFSQYFDSDNNLDFPIDSFIDKKHREYDIEPLEPADPRTLIRRLSFDLTGLPPEWEMVQNAEQFASPDRYIALVDELINSPHFGEQIARMWLDIARYSDTKGYVYAREERFQVHANTYRDWLINAFNSDLPYNRFIQYQIAADRYATHEPSHLAAMGFLTLGRRFLGVTHDIIDDRIDVVTRSTLGLTVACARCHDHKYDPIPTEDYYSLYGVFNNSTQRQIEIVDNSHPETPASGESRAELFKRQASLYEYMKKSRLEASDRVRSRIEEYLFAQSELQKFPEEGFDQILATNDLIPAFVRRWERYLASVKSEVNHPDQSIFRPWFLFASLKAEDFKIRSPETMEVIRNDPDIHPWVTKLFLTPPEDLREVAGLYGKLFSQIIEDEKKRKSVGVGQNAHDSHTLQSEAFLRILFEPHSPCEIPDEEIVSIEGFFDSGTLTEIWRLQGEVDRWRINVNSQQRVAVGLFDRQEIVLPRIFKRGVPANRGDIVGLHYLSLFADGQSGKPTPFRHGSGRWELADQITSPTNPLTPRVWVNRLWQHFFGQGLVKSTSDFGLRSDTPSHPELLDWLANDLVKSGWSTKSIIRKMVLSRAYQLSSGVGNHDRETIREQLEKDPENRLIWRHMPRRLRWEEQCDAILKSSGRLDSTPRFQQERLVAGTDGSTRRALYGFVDRQFVPNALRVFDFANPDLSIGRRSETTIPQQALYFLNNSFVANNVRAIAESIRLKNPQVNNAQSIKALFLKLFQRAPTEQELELGLQFVNRDAQESQPETKETDPWSYGVAKLDPSSSSLSDFVPLPHFTGTAWQGGPNWPDSAFGWAQLTAEGGHPGNDLTQSVVRRWIAPESMIIDISSLAKHQPDVADGVRFYVIHNEDKCLASVQLKASESRIDLREIAIETGDRIDFVVDIHNELNTDQFIWSPVITNKTPSKLPETTEHSSTAGALWDSKADFRGPQEYQLTPWEQYVHVMLCTNEFLFID